MLHVNLGASNRDDLIYAEALPMFSDAPFEVRVGVAPAAGTPQRLVGADVRQGPGRLA